MKREKEVWSQITGYEGKYEVSSWGRVKSCPRKAYCGHGYRLTKEKILAPVLMVGYLIVSLYDFDIKLKTPKIHRLVGDHFLDGKSEDRNQINHLDGIKTNNYFRNLQWCNPSENVRHSYDTGLNVPLVGEDRYNAKLTNTQVSEILFLYDNGVGTDDIAALYNITRSNVNYIGIRKTWKHISPAIDKKGKLLQSIKSRQ